MKWAALVVLVLVLAGSVVWVYVLATRVEQAVVREEAGPVATAPAASIARQAPAGPVRVARRPAPRSEPAPAPVPPPVEDDEVMPGERVLSFYSDADMAAFMALARRQGVEVVGRLDALRAVRVRGSAAALERLIGTGPTATRSGPNRVVRVPPEIVPPEAPAGVRYRDFTRVDPAEWMGAPTDRAGWGEGVVVAVFDTGVGSHPALDGVQVDRVAGADETAASLNPHGTAVASIIAGRGAVRGMAPGAVVLDMPVMDAEGRGNAFALASAIVEAVDHGAQVLNLSLGGYGDAYVLREAVAYAQRAGAVVVAAAGNDGVDRAYYPAAYPGVIGVGAVDAQRRRLYFSNAGEGVDVLAPGYGVPVAAGAGELGAFSGTSVAAPLVSGAIAALLSGDASLTPQAAAELVVRYADDGGAPGRDAGYGAGIANVRRVLERNTPGIHDLAVMRPYVRGDALAAGGLGIVLMAQNRGTEPAPDVTLRVEIDGVVQDVKFYDVDVGATVTYETSYPASMATDRAVQIEQDVVAPGVADVRPEDNRARTAITTSSQASPEAAH